MGFFGRSVLLPLRSFTGIPLRMQGRVYVFGLERWILGGGNLQGLGFRV